MESEELIPADDILRSQFPEVLQELHEKEARRDELEALFKEVNDLDEEEYNEDESDVLPKEVLKEVKQQIKETGAEIKALTKELKATEKRYTVTAKEIETTLKQQQKEPELFEAQSAGHLPIAQQLTRIKQRERGVNKDLDELIDIIERDREQIAPLQERLKELETRIARHVKLENELRDARKVIKESKDRKEELVEKAREKISKEEAKELILTRWKETLNAARIERVVVNGQS